MADNDSEDDWSLDRKEAIYNEGKRVLEAQKSDIDDLDDKSLRTVRIIAILFAVGATVAEVGEIDPNIDALLFSLGFLVFSSIFGVIVYNESYEVVGPKAEYFEKLEENEFDSYWRDDYVHQIPGYIRENQKTVEINTYFFTVCQVTFVVGFSIGILALIGISSANILAIVAILGLIVVACSLAIYSYL